MKPTIYTVGDSHAEHAWCKIPGVVARSIGPMLMYTFGKEPPRILDSLPKDAIICFCWGEIDCRCHIKKFPPWEETVDKLAESYLSGIKKLTEGFREVWVYNVVPPPRKEKVMENVSFPFLGTNEERLAYVKRLNKRLSESEYTFVDLYDEYSDEDGFLKMEISDYHVHVEDEKPLMNWINRKFSEVKI